MLIFGRTRTHPDIGVCFAWLPTWTPDGLVWLERIRYERTDGAYDINPWHYERLAPHLTQTIYATPPDIQKCKQLRTDGPTPCWYPNCNCMNEGGSRCGDRR